MAEKKITNAQRSLFTVEKVGSATKWIILSGTATYFLTELVKVLQDFDLPTWAVLLSNLVINVLIYGIAKYLEGQEK